MSMREVIKTSVHYLIRLNKELKDDTPLQR